jgi:hypothetical protein
VFPHDHLDDFGGQLAGNLALGIHEPPAPKGSFALETRVASVQDGAHYRRRQSSLQAAQTRVRVQGLGFRVGALHTSAVRCEPYRGV